MTYKYHLFGLCDIARSVVYTENHKFAARKQAESLLKYIGSKLAYPNQLDFFNTGGGYNLTKSDTQFYVNFGLGMVWTDRSFFDFYEIFQVSKALYRASLDEDGHTNLPPLSNFDTFFATEITPRLALYIRREFNHVDYELDSSIADQDILICESVGTPIPYKIELPVKYIIREMTGLIAKDNSLELQHFIREINMLAKLNMEYWQNFWTKTFRFAEYLKTFLACKGKAYHSDDSSPSGGSFSDRLNLVLHWNTNEKNELIAIGNINAWFYDNNEKLIEFEFFGDSVKLKYSVDRFTKFIPCTHSALNTTVYPIIEQYLKDNP